MAYFLHEAEETPQQPPADSEPSALRTRYDLRLDLGLVVIGTTSVPTPDFDLYVAPRMRWEPTPPESAVRVRLAGRASRPSWNARRPPLARGHRPLS